MFESVHLSRSYQKTYEYNLDNDFLNMSCNCEFCQKLLGNKYRTTLQFLSILDGWIRV